MPPWHADPAHRPVLQRAAADRRRRRRRSHAGSRPARPKAIPSDLPPAPQYAEGWRIGTARRRAVRCRRTTRFPPPATIAYQYFEVPANFTEDRWIRRGSCARATAPCVHHVIVYARPPQPRRSRSTPPQPSSGRRAAAAAGVRRSPRAWTSRRGRPVARRCPRAAQAGLGPNDRPRPRGTGGSIGGYVPGNSTRVFPTARRCVCPGSSLVFQMHYTTTARRRPIGRGWAWSSRRSRRRSRSRRTR